MEDEVDQCSVAKKCFKIEKKSLLINNDRLLKENTASDIMCTYLHSLNEVDNCGKCKSLDIVLLDLQESKKSLCELRKHFEKLKEYKISLDIAFINHKEKCFLLAKIKKNDKNEVQYSLRSSSMTLIYLNTPTLFLQLVDEHTTEDDIEVFSTKPGLYWISAHNFLTCLQKLSSYASGHLEVFESATHLSSQLPPKQTPPETDKN
ncbi:hypothetical protein Tco_0388988 [Tanacetum coccineum]